MSESRKMRQTRDKAQMRKYEIIKEFGLEILKRRNCFGDVSKLGRYFICTGYPL
jgi:hypothetical protein